MKKLFTMASIAIVFASCQNNQPKQLGPNEIEYAIYDGTPVDAVEDLEPVYIPFSVLGLHQPGDTVLTDTAGILVEFPPRDAETRRPVLTGIHKVVLGLRVEHNTHAESGKAPKFINAD